MNRVNLLFSFAAVCGLGALLLEVMSSGTFGRDAVLILLLLIAAATVAISLHIQLRGERQHRWVLSSRVKKLEKELALVSKRSSSNTEDRSTDSSQENESFVAENYPTLARIYDRIQALESEKRRGW